MKVIDEDARMTVEAGPYAGLDRFEARKRVVVDLEKLGLIEKIEAYGLSIAKCDRSGDVVEPLVSTQWFVKTKPLAGRKPGRLAGKRIRRKVASTFSRSLRPSTASN